MKFNLDWFTKEKGTSSYQKYLIAGPCSAESEQQVMDTANSLKDVGISLFRAGIWKPRTRPNSFEGVGEKGLPWLKRVKEETGLKVCIEVAKPQHVELALKYGIDVLWIGARTTVSPFAVQDLADTLRGVNIPIWVKNPVNPDVDLWFGAVERLLNVGIQKIGAIHRGFSSYGELRFRNMPNWQIPIELKRRIPDLPILVDPSHIAGKRELLSEVAQKAMDLNFDGLMVEVHNNPEIAKSDSAQQVDGPGYGKLLESLVIRSREVEEDKLRVLNFLREQIDNVDSELLELLSSRMNISTEIGSFKKENNISILQNARWNEIITKNLKIGEERGLSNVIISRIFNAIHQESIDLQTKVMNKSDD
jgi:chorismate mutase